ncbi:hypothetical protein [Methylobacterium sp. 275MFSha3.1]|uniref:hypothetical protein n=1 Tax=Methylobacterium sp. 275MFSha3.1 TaxID=1502746 RepID=UPI0011153995|nr:hypothetical protein [Methylobacterium sp. 275MFSha3.1]
MPEGGSISHFRQFSAENFYGSTPKRGEWEDLPYLTNHIYWWFDLNGILIFDLRLELADRSRRIRYFAYEDGGSSIEPSLVRQMIIDELGVDPGGWRDPVLPKAPTVEELQFQAKIDAMAEEYYANPSAFDDQGHSAPAL